MGDDKRCGAINVVWGAIVLWFVWRKSIDFVRKELIAIMLLHVLFVHSKTGGWT